LRLALVGLIRQMRPRGVNSLTPSRLSALVTIAAGGPLRIGELATEMAVSAPTVSHIVDALEEQGLIARHHDPRDGRACLVSASLAGLALLASERKGATGFLTDQIRNLPPEQQAALASALPALEAMGRHEGVGDVR
jgi:DNA-binding MarR family transcriptional regulator